MRPSSSIRYPEVPSIFRYGGPFQPFDGKARLLSNVTPVVNPFDTNGLWLRCALHAHTTASDGDLPPHKLVEHYERAGYDVLAITDHWKRTSSPSTEQLLVVASSAINCVLPEECDGHVLAYGIDEDPMEFAFTRPDFAQAAAWINEHGG